MPDRIAEIRRFKEKVKNASVEATKREAFKDLLNRLFADNEETRNIVDVITGGAEKRVLNIPRKDVIRSGAADQLYNRIIIEFENDLRQTLDHAKEQLAGYLLGQFHSGEGCDYTLIASDLLNWKVYSIDIASLEKLESLNEHEVILNEVRSASFELKDGNEDDFYYWIDRFLFKQEKLKATLAGIEEAFGTHSIVFREAYRAMQRYFDAVKNTGEMQVAYEEWKKMLSIAYDAFDDSTNNFLIHTYLSVIAKMLAYEVISNDPFVDDEEIKGILDGTIFNSLNLANFVERDFFAWVADEEARRSLKKVFRLISQELSTFDFSEVNEDVLKGVYQDLVDLDTRKRLGEYYTPDWLCERIVAEFNFRATDKILDPACGSGSFLRAVIDKLKRDLPEQSAEAINNQVHGIDIHPLSVQIAKTTVLLALGRKGLQEARRPVHINIILANTLLTPKGIKKFFGDELKMEIDTERLFVGSAIFDDAELFDIALQTADELAAQTQGTEPLSLDGFQRAIEQGRGVCITLPEIVEDFYKIYLGLKAAREAGRDSIWKFIVQNLYKPYFMAQKFDYVIGNPPWFTYSAIRNAAYQRTLDQLARQYDVKPDRAANFPHLEIAAIFLAYCSSFFLKPKGEIAFVLPRAFFSADHHDNTRRGKAEGFTLTEVWDLDRVSPLFRVPSCVLFAERPAMRKESGKYEDFRPEALKQHNIDVYTGRGIPGVAFSGLLSVHNSNWAYAGRFISERPTTYYYLRQGGSSAFSERQIAIQGDNPYKNLFRQGATIVPRNFYFVELDQDEPPDYQDRILNVKTASGIDAKKPWNQFRFEGRIESRFLFRTALSKSILPFALYKPSLVALPASVEVDGMGHKEIRLHSAKDLRENGFLNAARWFTRTEATWEEHKTEKSKDMSAIQRLDFQRLFVEQNLNVRYLVLYNSSAVNANAAVTDRNIINLEFIADHKAYMLATNDFREAYYLMALLNSEVTNDLMKDFQSRGLFGARDVHRKILDIYWPRFDSQNSRHQALSFFAQVAHDKAAEFLRFNPPQGDLTTHRLGRLRLDIKNHLTDELREIDSLVKELIL